MHPASATGAKYRSGMSCGLEAVDTSVHQTNAARIGSAVLSAQVVVPKDLGPGVGSAVEMTVMDRRALVLGGGRDRRHRRGDGPDRLAGLGIDLAAAGVITGTSAGAVAGTDIACGRELEALTLGFTFHGG